jgi:hypothetical protein
MLVAPKPCSLKNLDAWRDFWSRVARLSAAKLEALSVELCHRQETAHYHLVHSVRQQLDAARAGDDLARELVRVALWLGDLTAFASYPTKDKAFAIDSSVWDVMALGYHDAHRSIEDGIFAINCAKYRANSIERELANRPLFINGGVADRWLRIGPPSGAQQCKTAKAIIKHHKVRHGVQPMRKADFVTAAVDALPGLTRHRAEQLWGDHAPEAWKKAGTKKGN